MTIHCMDPNSGVDGKCADLVPSAPPKLVRMMCLIAYAHPCVHLQEDFQAGTLGFIRKDKTGFSFP